MDFFTKQRDELSHKVYINLLKILSLLSALSIIGNIIFGFPFDSNIKWIVLLSISFISLFFLKKDLYVYFWKTLFITSLTFLFIPFSWFESGGSANSIISYFFLLIICTTIFYWGRIRLFFIISQVSIFITFFLLEQAYPEFLHQYNPEVLFFDKLFQTPITLLAAYLFLRIFANAYNKEKKRLNQLVHFDSLTGVYNRRSFDLLLEKVLLERDNSKTDLYIIFLDIDNFKLINDEKGHHIGDKVLVNLANYIKNHISSEDSVARWGGDEFAIIFSGPKSELLSIMTKVHKFPISLSSGATQINPEDHDITKILKRVDKAAYRAKSEGKNRFCIL